VSFLSFEWLGQVDLIWVTVIVTVGYLLLLGWSLTRRRAELCEGAPDRRPWRDLRLWIVPLILIQIALHWWFR
jgi:hypothetical protein